MRCVAVLFAALVLPACSEFTVASGPEPPPAASPEGGPAPGEGDRSDGRSEPTFAFGTVATDPKHAVDEASGGARHATLELSWGDYEPVEGMFDESYAAKVRADLSALTRAGMHVTLDFGLYMTPLWVFDLPSSRFVDQYGNESAQPNFVFNERIREKAAAYIDRIHRDVGLSSFWAIRIGSGGSNEVLYPGEGSYWAFDSNAKNGPDMPATMSKNPFPQWRPGSRTIATAQVSAWADWYIGALANSVDWQIVKLGSLGFSGYYQVLTPSVGVRPLEYVDAIAGYLPDGLTGVGVVWHKLYELLPHKANVVAFQSAMADGTADNDECTPADKAVPLDDPRVMDWSGARWLSRIADGFGLAKSGQNPSFDRDDLRTPYRDASANGMLAASIRQMKSCGYQGMYWARSESLWNGTLPFSAYANAIKAANGP